MTVKITDQWTEITRSGDKKFWQRKHKGMWTYNVTDDGKEPSDLGYYSIHFTNDKTLVIFNNPVE